MKIFFVKILVIFCLIFLVGCEKNFSRIYVDNGKNLIEINVEIADDNNERIKGLMLKENLEEGRGMFFIFEDESYHKFWMKNTSIPLDIIFIDKNFRIIEVKNALPCKKEPCILYEPSKPAKYVLEVNLGFAARNKISTGNEVKQKVLK